MRGLLSIAMISATPVSALDFAAEVKFTEGSRYTPETSRRTSEEEKVVSSLGKDF